jgi:hypothetical protein
MRRWLSIFARPIIVAALSISSVIFAIGISREPHDFFLMPSAGSLCARCQLY